METAHFTIQYCPVPETLMPLVESIFYTDVNQAGHGRFDDVIFPAWGSLRFQYGEAWQSWVRGSEEPLECSFAVTGPRTQEMRFSMGTGRQWGFRLLPLGWATLIGVHADRYANAIADGDVDEAFVRFRPLSAILGTDASPGEQYDRLVAFLAGLSHYRVANVELTEQIAAAVVDPRMRTAAQLAETTGANPRTLERACRAVFGFTPKMLLRRQRFLRSLEHYARDPALRWVGAMDQNYHDQAQFVRDFRFFMGMTPRQYAALEKPVNSLLMRERLRTHDRSRED
jgi:AraC-type DNA-binding domain-containing proteins